VLFNRPAGLEVSRDAVGGAIDVGVVRGGLLRLLPRASAHAVNHDLVLVRRGRGGRLRRREATGDRLRRAQRTAASSPLPPPHLQARERGVRWSEESLPHYFSTPSLKLPLLTPHFRSRSFQTKSSRRFLSYLQAVNAPFLLRTFEGLPLLPPSLARATERKKVAGDDEKGGQ